MTVWTNPPSNATNYTKETMVSTVYGAVVETNYYYDTTGTYDGTGDTDVALTYDGLTLGTVYT